MYAALEKIDSKKFHQAPWSNPEIGKGLTTILLDSDIFEKAGIGVSSVSSMMSGEVATLLKVRKEPFSACGLSLIFHPSSPKIPTIHMNVRYFETKNTFWFGGGVDLTPYYPHEADFILFHKSMKQAVLKTHLDCYEAFKAECDRYFTLPHRGEMRGIGGIFFDHLKDEKAFELVKNVGDALLPFYLKIISLRKNETSSLAEKEFQLWRRGRYVEFNLLYDRGTAFGLKAGGKTESILMSLPTTVTFPYDRQIKKDSFEETMNAYYQPKKWV